MSAPTPEVSVLVVAHNAGRFLAPALASVLDQRGVEFELILVDNASTDGSVEAALAARPDPRLRLVRPGKNLEHAGGINAGLPHCRAPVVAFMDADDLSLPGRLRRQLDYLAANPGVDLAGCVQDAIDAAGQTLGAWFALTRTEDILAYARFDMPFPVTGAVVRRDLLQRLGWRTQFRWAPDYDFLLRAIETARVACLPEVLYQYRVHGASVSLKRKPAHIRSAACARLAACRRAAGLDEDLAGLAAEQADRRDENLTEAEVYENFGRRYLAGGFPGPAIMFARRAWAHGRAGPAVAIVATALAAALVRTPRRWPFLLRLALLGPAHALRVESRPPLTSRWSNPFRARREFPPGQT